VTSLCPSQLLTMCIRLSNNNHNSNNNLHLLMRRPSASIVRHIESINSAGDGTCNARGETRYAHNILVGNADNVMCVTGTSYEYLQVY
jgi:hypothetical protein